jgi:hypothetical protein
MAEQTRQPPKVWPAGSAQVASRWRAEPDCGKILRDARGRASQRKVRLLACACCRQAGRAARGWPGWALLETVERFADGEVSEAELRATRERAALPHSSAAGAWLAEAVVLAASPPWGGPETALEYAARAARDAAGERDWAAARKAQVRLACDLLGHLLRQVAVSPAWLEANGGAVLQLARAIYQDHSFADLPVLADALEEAGCQDPDILDHCRSGLEHARGCWVVDALLGKE